MKNFQDALDDYLCTIQEQPRWDRHVPDELYSHIATLADFRAFLKFIDEHHRSELLEFGCDETERFLSHLAKIFDEPHFQEQILKKRIESDLGQLAYAMVLSMGN